MFIKQIFQIQLYSRLDFIVLMFRVLYIINFLNIERHSCKKSRYCYIPSILSEHIIFTTGNQTIVQKQKMGNQHLSNAASELKTVTEILRDLPNKLEEIVELKKQTLPQRSSSIDKHTQNNKNSNLLQPRFRSIIIPPPECSEDDDEQSSREKKLKQWLGEVVKTVLSNGFYEFKRDEMNLKQTKIFCSQNILFNIVNYSQKHSLSSSQFQKINHLLKNDLLPYNLLRYPQSEEAEVNLYLNRNVKQIKSSESNDHDLIYKSKVQFKLCRKQNYNETIMKFLNYVIQLPQKELSNSKPLFCEKKEQEKGRHKKLYSMFQKDFQDLFHNLEIESQLQRMKSGKQKGKKSQNDKDYRRRVQNYTKYLIGRKLSQNIKTFTEDEIMQGCLELKNSSLMRVVTKWCKQLRKNFQKPQKLCQKDQFRMLDGSERPLNPLQLIVLQKLLEKKQKKVKEYLQEIMKNNYELQSKIASENITEKFDVIMFSKEESSVGIFSTINQKNYETYLIGYLNVLIHNLLSVMEEFHDGWHIIHKAETQNKVEEEKKIDIDEIMQKIEENTGLRKQQQYGTMEKKKRTPNLITFRVSDLLRCKCSSREEQINALCKQIERISQSNHELFEIVQIDNRLQKGTKDIQISLMYRSLILIQVQLAINQNKSKFLDCSDQLNHYIYELKRAQFGPISEMCNVFINYDARANFYKDKFESKNKRKRKDGNNLKKQLSSDQMQLFYPKLKKMESIFKRNQAHQGDKKEYLLPFYCDNCFSYYNEAYYLGKNQYFRNNTQKICFPCVLDELSTYEEIKKKVMPQLPQLSDEVTNPQLIVKINNQLPPFGILVLLKSRYKIPKYFKKIRKGDKEYLFERIGNTYQNLGQVTTPEQKENFLLSNLVFSYSQLQNDVYHIKKKEVTIEYFFPRILNQVNQQRKFFVNLSNIELEDKDFQKIKNPILPLKKVDLSANTLSDMKNIFNCFPSLEALILNRNAIVSTADLDKLINLRQIKLRSNKMNKFPPQLKKLTHLELLNINSNQIEQLPKFIGQLSLKYLNLSNNKLKQLPNQFSNLQYLTQLKIQQNELKELPKNFGNLPLQSLSMMQNHLEKLPDSFGKLEKMKHLDLSNNKLKQLPDSFGKLSSLEKANLEQNNLISLPNNFGNLEKLLELDLSQNDLSTLPDSFCILTQLMKLYLSNNKFKQLPENFNNLNLEELEMSNNQLTCLPKNFGQIVELQSKDHQHKYLSQRFGQEKVELQSLNKNQLDQLMTLMIPPKKLKILKLKKNYLQNLPQTFSCFYHLQIINLSNNKLKNIPKEIMGMPKVKFIDLSQNEISEINKDGSHIFQLPKLMELKMNLNPLVKISKELLYVPTKQLNLDQKKLDEQSQKIYERLKNKLLK